jgi:hypothetical protein
MRRGCTPPKNQPKTKQKKGDSMSSISNTVGLRGQGRASTRWPTAELSSQGIEIIQAKMAERGLATPPGHETGDWTWNWNDKAGTWPKRLARWVKARHDKNNLAELVEVMRRNPETGEIELKMEKRGDPNFLSSLGQLYRLHSTTDEVIVYDIADRFDWRDGDYGDAGSCFFTSDARRHIPQVLEDAGCLALRVYDPIDHERGIGRCWIAPTAHGLVVFNSYHRHGKTLVFFARLLALVTGMSQYDRITLVNNGQRQGSLYINGDADCNAWIVHDGQSAPPAKIDLGIDARRHAECDRCGCDCDADDAVTVERDTWCADCADQYAAVCGRCDDRVDRRNSVEVDGEDWCMDCADDNSHECECPHCSERHRNRN